MFGSWGPQEGSECNGPLPEICHGKNKISGENFFGCIATLGMLSRYSGICGRSEFILIISILGMLSRVFKFGGTFDNSEHAQYNYNVIYICCRA